MRFFLRRSKRFERSVQLCFSYVNAEDDHFQQFCLKATPHNNLLFTEISI